MDGRGYPFGHKGDAIPLSAKIVSIADCFDAMTTDRPYQKRKDCNVAISMLDEASGTSFCQDLVAMFIDEIRYKGMVHHIIP
jgi:HD-GYP domain-containing protein (c-di-GMP phosphodiesterase class II)